MNKLSHNEKAALRVVEALKEGRVLRAHNALSHETTTVGGYNEAVDRGIRWAVIGWRTGNETLVRTAEQAARAGLVIGWAVGRLQGRAVLAAYKAGLADGRREAPPPCWVRGQVDLHRPPQAPL